ncbi:MAG: sigma-70 family RNA polymerase sigma factor [Propionibacteriaceae bacterium]|jgi:RNA polymerase sigma-70 factor (ECF subfamily)|nr:sigma-70 family RNA polymerase sigma factor [Propionibacteriaceae bacterium]
MAANVATDTTVTTDTAAVVARYQGLVYSICLTHTRSRSDADDAFQEVFMTYHRKQPVCSDEEHLKAWLINTTLTTTRRVAGSAWYKRVVLLGMAEDEAGFFRSGVEEYDTLFHALMNLPEIYRTVIHLFYVEDLPIGRIAVVLRIEPGAVKMRLARGRLMLREALHKEDYGV